MLLVKDRPKLQDFIDKYGSRWPLLLEFKNTEQDSVWHAEGNVHIHTDLVLQEMYKLLDDGESDSNVLMFAAALHDYGKPITSKPVEKPDGVHIGCPRHEEVGASLLLNTACPEELSYSEWLKVIQLVCYHQMPKKLVIQDKGLGHYVRLMDAVYDLRLLHLLEKADMLGRVCSDTDTNMLYLELFHDEVIKHDLQCPYTFHNTWLKDEKSYHRTTSVLGHSIHMMDEGASLPFNYSDSSTVTLMCGLPGSGKSSIAKSLGATIISMDDIRDTLGGRGKPDNSKVHRIAMDNLRSSLRLNEDVVWDATNYRSDFRKKIIDLALQYGAYVRILVVTADVNECIRRDLSREHSVGRDVILNQYNKFQIPHYEEAHYLEFVNGH